MKKSDVVVIGGSAASIAFISALRKLNGNVSVTVIRMFERSLVPCGIPYIFGVLQDTSKDVIPDSTITNLGAEIIVNEVIEIDRKRKRVVLKSGEDIEYKKLIIATGSLPVVPKFIPGYDLDNIFVITKDEKHLRKILDRIKDSNNIVIVGGGFIGVEVGEQLKIAGKNVTIVELMDRILWQSFDPEYSSIIEEKLKENGINVITGVKVKEFIGENGKVKKVVLENNTTLEADLVIAAIGTYPNTELARKANINITPKGFIEVDEYMRTSDPDILAIGDCAQKKCFFTGKDVPIMLASIAAREGRIAGINLFELRIPKRNSGTIATFSTKVFGLTAASVGLTEWQAKSEGFDIEVGVSKGVDKHPATLPEANQVFVKLVFSRKTGTILGAQIIGGDTAGEMINIMALAVQNRLRIDDICLTQVATHPLLTAAPTAYQLNMAAINGLSSI
ncbi:MAG: FAD-dependent oxidoreductase [candidate division WOR-3 bacterium]